MEGLKQKRPVHPILLISTGLFLTSILPYLLTSVSAQETKLPPANTVVKPKACASLDKIPRGRAFDVAVVAEIMPGFHVNSNKPSEDYLIPTQLLPELPAGYKVLGTTYPPGKLLKFEFSEKKLSVYEGKFTLRMRLQAPAGAPLGATKLSLTLRYQACNESACLPPVKIPVPLEIEIAAAVRFDAG
ncbi:MAG: protein-disulfide reductase DsbD N-terminal domain-containing protein, partial [Acidobacteria bacterium]|nr:protein-disulfide reductase DsbD N-terminal domain-containing protein [Acidobacteriota bacterium]